MMLGYLIMCLIFGTTFLAIKVGLEAGWPPLLFAGLRFTAAGLLALGWALWRRAPLPRTGAQWGQVAAVGISSTAITFAALFWAEQHISSGLAAILSAASPTLTLVLMPRRSRAVGLAGLMGLLAGMAGVALVVVPQFHLAGGALVLISVGVMLVGEVTSAWGSVQARVVMDQGVPPLVLNALQMLLGGLALLAAAAAVEPLGQVQPTAQALGALAYLILVGSVVGRGLYYWLIARTGPLFPSTWTYVSPVIATLAGGWLLHEPLGWWSWAGLFLVLAGAGLTDPKALGRILAERKRGGGSDVARPGPELHGASAAAD